MPVLDSFTVRGKLLLAFGSVLLLMFALGGLAVAKLARLHGVTGQILTYRVSGIRDSSHMITRRYWPRGGTSTPSSFSTASEKPRLLLSGDR